MAREKSVIGDAAEIERAVALIRLGARLPLLEAEINLSREKLLRLYKEIHHRSPPKGMLPFSTDWFISWQPNIHSSLFANIYEYLQKTVALEQIDAIIRAYRLYVEQVSVSGLEPILSITRAWRLVKFIDAGMLSATSCTLCKGLFIARSDDLRRGYVCGLCNMPARAGKGAAHRAAHVAGETARSGAEADSAQVL
jgi:flagellar transcriptional activator FlhC